MKAIFRPFIHFSAKKYVEISLAVKVGEFGSQEGYLIVTITNLDYRLGPIGDASATARYATAMAAMAANKPIMLRFWDPYNTCTSASTAFAIPNSVQILQQ